MESKSLLWFPQFSRDYAVQCSKTADFLQCEHSVESIVPLPKNEMNYFWVPLPVQRMDALSSRCDRDIRWGCGLGLGAEHSSWGFRRERPGWWERGWPVTAPWVSWCCQLRWVIKLLPVVAFWLLISLLWDLLCHRMALGTAARCSINLLWWLSLSNVGPEPEGSVV